MAPALLNFMCKYIIKEEWKIHSEYLCFCDVLILSWHPDNWHLIDIVTVDVPHKRIEFATSKPLCNMAVRWWMLTLAEVRKSTSIHDWKSLDKSKYNWRAIEQCFLSLQFKITPDLNARPGRGKRLHHQKRQQTLTLMTRLPILVVAVVRQHQRCLDWV